MDSWLHRGAHASPILAHGLHGILTRRGASTPNRGDGCRGDEGQAQYPELPARNGEIDAPIEGLAIDDVNQDQAQSGAENESVRNPEGAGQNAFTGQHADDLTAQHSNMPQHAELGSAGEGGRTWRKAHTGESDDDCDRLERVGDCEGTIEDLQRALAQRGAGQYLERIAACKLRPQRCL